MDQPTESTKKIKYYRYWPVILQSIIYFCTFIVFKIFCKFKVVGKENLIGVPKKAIFAANHSSEWDPIMVRYALPFFSQFSPMYYVSLKKESYNSSGWRQYFYGGKLFELLGAYPVYSGFGEYELALKHHINILNSGNTLCIFPEGKKTRDGSIGKARGGVAYLAYRTNTPVIPVTISGLYGLNLKYFLLRKITVTIHYSKPLTVSDLFGDSKLELLKDHTEFREVAANIMNTIGLQKK
jgi:1-acyl-sn-glycerol-3-phosphate acyltransferase